MKREVYHWRLPAGMKSERERAARLRRLPVSSVLDMAVRDWLKKNAADRVPDLTQRHLHSAAAACIGILAGASPRCAETTRRAIRERLGRRYTG